MSAFVINPSLQIPWDELQFTYSRSSGPGGQNVNKVNSKATLRWDVRSSEAISPAVKQRFEQHWGARINKDGVLILQSDEHREQRGNIEECLARLRHMVLISAKRPKVRVATKPSRSAIRRRKEAKQQQSQRKAQRRRSKNISTSDDG